MPIDYKKYGKEFIALSKILRGFGRCAYCGNKNGEPNPRTGSKVVLTVHHENHIITDNSLDNLVPLCQQCHLLANKCKSPYYEWAHHWAYQLYTINLSISKSTYGGATAVMTDIKEACGNGHRKQHGSLPAQG